VELHADEVGVLFELHNLHALAEVVLADKVETRLGQSVDVLRVDLISVAVTLQDLASLTVKLADLGPFASGLEDSGAESQPHGTSEVGLGALRHEDDDGFRSFGRDLDGMGVLESADVASVFDNGNLHSQANSQVRRLVLSGPFRGRNHSLCASRSESTGNQDSVGRANVVPRLVEFRRVEAVHGWLKGFGLDPHEVQLASAAHCRVFQTLDSREIRVVKIGVLADKRNGHGFEQTILGKSKSLPLLPEILAFLDVRSWNVDLIEFQRSAEEPRQVLVVQKDRDVVSGVDIVDSKDLLVVDITKECDLLDGRGVEGLLATACNLSRQKLEMAAGVFQRKVIPSQATIQQTGHL
jgi:hypothetical protein